MFINPFSETSDSSEWRPVTLAQLDFPVTMHYADISGNGLNDVIISDRYGPSMDDIWQDDGGRVNWLENPGDNSGNWKIRRIGNSPAMHRLKAGHFTRKDRVQIVAVPIITKSSDLSTPAPVIIYTAPADPKTHQGDWPSETVWTRLLVHEVFVVPSDKTDGVMPFDQIVLAGADGVDVLWFDSRDWQKFKVGNGLLPTPDNPFYGAGSVSVGRVGNDYAGYICCAEAFHGNTVSVYTKAAGAPHGIVHAQWNRHELTDFAPLNAKHTGSIHQVVCADIDGDGEDEFLVAMMGSDPADFERTGVWCYKLTDKVNGKFSMTKISNISAGRIATANFHSESSEVDIATISYSVPGYFESPNPSINVLFSTGILAEKLDEEVSFRVVRAGSTRFKTEMEFLDVSGRKMTLVVLPPHTSFPVKANISGVKVMAGTVRWGDLEKVPAIRLFERETMVVSSGHLTSGEEGAIFVLFKPSTTSGKAPFSTMDQLVAHNIFPRTVPTDVRAMTFPWVKVENRPWAHGRFKDLEFYNLVGFHVRFADDSMEELAHVQLWTAGIGVSAGFHNHVEKSFCEIHACIVNGTGKGGMRWATVADQDFDPSRPDLSKTELIIVPDMYEHGPLWRAGPDGYPLLRMNDTIDYPWHAWLAGDGSPQPQSFDVWVAFEFPSFETYASPKPEMVIAPGQYTIKFTNPIDTILSLRDEDPTDGALVVGLLGEHSPPQRWNVSRVPGTDMYEIANSVTGSLLCAQWPPIDNQLMVGTHSPANMGLTSRWAVSKNADGDISFRLASAPEQAHLFLSVAALKEQGALEVPVVLRSANGVEQPSWSLVPA